MVRKNQSSLDETKAVRNLRTQIRERKSELERAVSHLEELKLELIIVQREYESRVEPLVIETELLDERIFELKKVHDLLCKGENLENARRIVRERGAEREAKERKRLDSEENPAVSGRESTKDRQKKKDESGIVSSPELKKLWRELAYRFHPDLTQNAEEKLEREAMMKRLNDAYQRGDVVQMRELAATGCCITPVKSGGNETELAEQLLDLDEALRRLTQRLLAFRRSPWYGMRLKLRRGKREQLDYFSELETAQRVGVAARKQLVTRIERELQEFSLKTR